MYVIFSEKLPFRTKYLRMDQAKFVEESLSKILDDMVCLAEPYHLNFLGCLPQILLVPFWNTFLLPDTHTGVRNVSFLEYFA